MTIEWYIQHGGKQYGPLTGANLKKLAAEGKITPATSVRRGADGNWVPASRVQGLFAANAAASAHAAASPPPPRAGKPPSPAKVVAPVTPTSSDPFFDDLPPLAAPPIEPPAAPLRANPLGTPVAPLQPRGRVPKAAPVAAPSVAPRIVGGVAVILAAVAVTTCWLPLLGGLIGWTGIVAGTLGLLVGGGGLALAAKHKGSGLILNVFGGAGAAVGLVLSIVLGVAFGMFTSKPVSQPIVAAKPVPVQPTPTPIQQPEPEPEPVWTDASQPIQQGDIKAAIVSVKIEQVRIEDITTFKKAKPQPMLKIKVALENTSQDKIVEFPGWIGGGDMVGPGLGQLVGGEAGGALAQLAGSGAILSDNVGNKYKQTPISLVFGGALTVNQDNSIRPGKVAEKELLFSPPLESIEYLRLELPPAGFSGSEPLRWEIPKGVIKGFAAPSG